MAAAAAAEEVRPAVLALYRRALRAASAGNGVGGPGGRSTSLLASSSASASASASASSESRNSTALDDGDNETSEQWPLPGDAALLRREARHWASTGSSQLLPEGDSADARAQLALAEARLAVAMHYGIVAPRLPHAPPGGVVAGHEHGKELHAGAFNVEGEAPAAAAARRVAQAEASWD